MPDAEIIQGLLAKIQPTPGTDSVPTVGTDAVRITQERLFSKIKVDYEWQNLRDDTASLAGIVPPKPALPRGRKVRMDFFWEGKGAGSDVPPEVDPLLRACGLAQTDGAQLFSYAQASTGHELASIYVYAGGLLFKVRDCRGVWRWPLATGTMCVFQFTMLGLLDTDPATAALPGGITYDSNEPVVGVNSGLSIGGVVPAWINGVFDPIGAEPELLESGNAVDGIAGFDYAMVTPRFSLNVRKDPLATYDPYADLKARTTRALLLTYGSTQFNRIKLLSTNLSYLEHAHAAAKGYAHFDLNWFVEQFTLQFD